MLSQYQFEYKLLPEFQCICCYDLLKPIGFQNLQTTSNFTLLKIGIDMSGRLSGKHEIYHEMLIDEMHTNYNEGRLCPSLLDQPVEERFFSNSFAEQQVPRELFFIFSDAIWFPNESF